MKLDFYSFIIVGEQASTLCELYLDCDTLKTYFLQTSD